MEKIIPEEIRNKIAIKYSPFNDEQIKLQEAAEFGYQLATQQEGEGGEWIAVVKEAVDLIERFIPKQVALDNYKEMAMNKAYHRLKNLLASAPGSNSEKLNDKL